MLYRKLINLNNNNDSLTQIYNLVSPNTTCLDVGCATGGLALEHLLHPEDFLLSIKHYLKIKRITMLKLPRVIKYIEIFKK